MATSELARCPSELLKQLANEPCSGLGLVVKHIREKGIREQVELKEKLLVRLVELRERTSSARPTRFVEQGERLVKVEASTAEEVDKAAAVLQKLTSRIDALNKKAEIISEVHEGVLSPTRGRRLGSILRKPKSQGEEPLPVSLGQDLDSSLLSGDIDIDAYASEITKLAKAYSDRTLQEKSSSS